MSYNSASMNSMVNYFNNLISQQMMAQNFYNNVKTQNASSTNNSEQTTSTEETSEELSTALSNALTGLAALISGGNASSTNALSSSMSYAIGDLISKGVDAQKLTDLVNSMAGQNDDDLLYTRTGSNDPWITLDNRAKMSGADIQSVLYQAGTLANKGQDVNAYLDMVENVVNKADYDDVRRLVSVTNTMIYANQDLNKFYEFGNEILDKRHYDFESNIFSVQTLVGYGANLDTSLKIMRNMENTGLDGRNNMVDLNRVTIDARKKGMFLPYFFDQMAKSGDTRAFMNQYMEANGMETTAPDFERFDRIERIDGEDMVITEGESAALFAQAISNRDGLLDKSVLFWSSLQTGAMSNGDNYLDLSKLAAGTYDIYVKIGNYGGGTDTAKKRVIVKAKEEEVLVDGGNQKPKENNGLGDMKDSDNTVKFEDASNPGKGNVNAGPKVDDAPKTNNEPKVNENKVQTENKVNTPAPVENKNTAPVQTENKVNNNEPVKETKTTTVETTTVKEVSQEEPEISDIDKMRRLYGLSLGRISASEAYDYIDEKVGKGNVVKFLNEIGQSSMAQKYENRSLGWMDFMLAMAKDPQFYQKASAEFRRNIPEQDAAQFFKSNEFNDKDTKEALWLLGYRNNEPVKNVEVKKEEKVKSNNGLGDMKDSDNTVKFQDASNPGKGNVNAGPKVENKKEEVKTEKTNPVTATTLQEAGKIKVEVKKGDAALSSDLYMVHNGQEILVAKDANKTGVNTVLERDFKEGDQVSFFIRTKAESWGLGTYDHGNEELSQSGKPYAQKTMNSNTSWTIGFEDLPEGKADWDYNDVVLNVTLLPLEKKKDKKEEVDLNNNILNVNNSSNNKKEKVEEKEDKKETLNLNNNVLPEIDNKPKKNNDPKVVNGRVFDVKKEDNSSDKEVKGESLSEKYKKNNEEYRLALDSMTKNSANYRKQLEEERARLRNKEVENSLNSKNNDNSLLEKRLETDTKVKSNNGLGDMKDSDNKVKFQDASNPGNAEKR